MDAFALTLVLSAAFLHALWNAMVKAAVDRAIVLGIVAAAHGITGLTLVLLTEPPSAESWFYLFASTLIHYAYYGLLFQSYRLGDLSQVYPISRGLAPLLVALGALLLIGENLPPAGWMGLIAVSLGIAFLAAERGAARADPRAIAAAVATGLMIASYSVVDGIGIRRSGSPFGYIGWLFFLEMPVFLFVMGRRRPVLKRLDGKVLRIGLGGGLFSVAAYGLVLYAKTLAPLGAVSAVRESSVIIAALIGVVVFGERPWAKRLLSAVMVGAGVVLLAFNA